MKRIIIFISAISLTFGFSACSDFFDQESDHVIYSENHSIENAEDSIYSMTGILMKMQAIADRTILLGEVRGDLVDLTTTANSDLRDLAQFNASDDNRYNTPRDYYAIINNCNYFIAKADTAKKNNRNEYLLMKEYAAIKSIRAWTYLQLAINYGSVPFVTDPILTKEESEANYPKYDIQAICEYFINDLLPIEQKELYNREYPGYGKVRNTISHYFYFPLNIILGDLYLWHGTMSGNTESYKQAALRYYKYISTRNGDNTTYTTGIDRVFWPASSTTWLNPNSAGWISSFYNEDYTQNEDQHELITMIPGDSIRAEGNYSELRNLFNSTTENDYKVSITPSKRIQEISESQMYCSVSNNGMTVTYAPSGLTSHRTGDLRLSEAWYETTLYNDVTNDRIDYQRIDKFSTRNVHIYRKQMIYLRMAEALNMAGFPRAAYQILASGLNNTVIKEAVIPYCNESDSVFISQFDFPNSRCVVFNAENAAGLMYNTPNMLGIHSRGSGYSPLNEYYQLPVDSTRSEVEQLADLQTYVSELILNESALEFAFEGVRYYDIMRYALRQSNPGEALARCIYQRRGAANSDAMRGVIRTDLNNRENWFLHWTGI